MKLMDPSSKRVLRSQILQLTACVDGLVDESRTIFQDTRKPLRLWLRAMWHVTAQKNGTSALGLQRVLGLGSYQTAWAWFTVGYERGYGAGSTSTACCTSR